LQSLRDHGVVEQPPETQLVGETPLDLARQLIVVRDDAAEREKRAQRNGLLSPLEIVTEEIGQRGVPA
jgi:hypothetical protein